LIRRKKIKKSVIKDVDEVCVMMSKDKKFLNNNFINKFVFNDLIDDSEDNKKNIEFFNDKENNKKNNK